MSNTNKIVLLMLPYSLQRLLVPFRSATLTTALRTIIAITVLYGVTDTPQRTLFFFAHLVGCHRLYSLSLSSGNAVCAPVPTLIVWAFSQISANARKRSHKHDGYIGWGCTAFINGWF